MILRLAYAAATVMLVSSGALAFELGMPAQCTLGQDCFVQQFPDVQSGPERSDPFCGSATYEGHDGTDIRVLSMHDVARGVPVFAMADGIVMVARDGTPDKLVKNQAEAEAISSRGCGNAIMIDHGNGYRTRYCHMRESSLAVKKGDIVKRGQQIGLIGSSGLAQFPHIEVAVLKDGKPIDPTTGQSLEAGCLKDASKAAPLFSKDVAAAMGKGESQVMAIGVAGNVIEHNSLSQDGPPPAATTGSPNRIGWAWFINLRQGDQVQVRLTDPAGKVVADQKSEAMNRAKADYSAFSGKRGAPEAGDYEVYAAVIRDGAAVQERSERITVK